MGTEEIPLHDRLSTNATDTTGDARVRVRVSCEGKDAFIKKGSSATQLVEVKSIVTKAVIFTVDSTLEPAVEYSDTHSNHWPASVSVNPRRNGFARPAWIRKSSPLEHVGVCAPANSHTVTLVVDVAPAVQGEAVDIGTDSSFYYQVSCEC